MQLQHSVKTKHTVKMHPNLQKRKEVYPSLNILWNKIVLCAFLKAKVPATPRGIDIQQRVSVT